MYAQLQQQFIQETSFLAIGILKAVDNTKFYFQENFLHLITKIKIVTMV